MNLWWFLAILGALCLVAVYFGLRDSNRDE